MASRKRVPSTNASIAAGASARPAQASRMRSMSPRCRCALWPPARRRSIGKSKARKMSPSTGIHASSRLQRNFRIGPRRETRLCRTKMSAHETWLEMTTQVSSALRSSAGCCQDAPDMVPSHQSSTVTAARYTSAARRANQGRMGGTSSLNGNRRSSGTHHTSKFSAMATKATVALACWRAVTGGAATAIAWACARDSGDRPRPPPSASWRARRAGERRSRK